jgi:hypothetical protein
MGTLPSIAARCAVIGVAATVAVCGIAHAGEGPRTVSLEVCIDGLDNLHVKDGQLLWEHLAYERPGLHVGCKGVSDVDGVPWRDWSKGFPVPVPRGATVAFHPVRCRSNCVLVQSPSAANGWEAIYQFDDYVLGGSDVYCVNIVIGGPSESAADQSVQHVAPAPVSKGGRPLFAGPGGKLRDDEACPQKPVS